MNGVKKFHSANGPAFNKGERWIGSSGAEYEIVSTHRYGIGKWDVDVYYQMVRDTRVPKSTFQSDAWNFQARCCHVADLVV